MDEEKVKKLAEAHVDWWLKSVRQPMIDEFIHGYKHGQLDPKKEK